MNEPQQAETQAVESYEALLEAIETLTRHEDLPTLFHELAPRLKRVVPFDFISVLLYDEALQMMRLHILESDRALDAAMGPDHSPSESPGGLVWQSQEPMIISSYDDEKRFPSMTPVWRAFGMKSGYYLPLTTPQHRLGAINFASAQSRAYDAWDLRLFGRVARLVAVAGGQAALELQPRRAGLSESSWPRSGRSAPAAPGN